MTDTGPSLIRRSAQILPVIDLKGGAVVRGVAGRREEYQPVRSRLTSDARPGSVALAFAKLGFRDVYVADLDAIAGAAPAWKVYDEIAAAGLQLVIDAGLSSVSAVQELADFVRGSTAITGVVLGSESAGDAGLVQKVREQFGSRRAIFSLDLQSGRPIVVNAAWSSARPGEIAATVVAAGYERLIVLDLAAVGVAEGLLTLELCRQLRREYPQLEIISGGGVRGEEDLRAYGEAGCDRVLVASALHVGAVIP